LARRPPRSQAAPGTGYGVAAAEYDACRQGFPKEVFNRLAALGVGRPGQRVLDLGCGTGLFAREFARRGCRVTGIDPDPAMLERAEAANRGEVITVRYLPGRAEATGQPDASFDVVAAGTAWHWFDRPAAAREAIRVLAPGGRLVIAHLDWHCPPGSVGFATQRLIDRHTAELAPPARPPTFLYPEWTSDLIEAGFREWEIFGGTTTLSYTPRAWRGRVRASQRVAPRMDPATLERFDAALARLLARQFPHDRLEVPHRVFVIVARP